MSALAKVRFFSKSLGMCVTCQVILPQRRDEKPLCKVPVLWLLHGAYGNYTDWMRYTSIERYAAPYGLAVVMPSGHNSSYADMAHGLKYYTYIAEELPLVLPRMLNLSTRREDNFIAGLSMGGAGSMMIGLSKPEQYAAIGCLSAGAMNTVSSSPVMDRAKKLAFGPRRKMGTYHDPLGCAQKILDERLPCPRIYHACGRDDHLLACAHETRDYFTSLPGNPFDYHYVEDEGSHTWDYWDAHIQDFLRFLNLPKKSPDFL